MNAFKGIATEKSAGLGAVAAGISEALVTTAVGLFVAVPAVWMFNIFSGRLEAMGFACTVTPSWGVTPFPNVLLTATRL